MSEFKTYEELPDWRIYTISTVHPSDHSELITTYEIFKRWGKKDEEQYKDVYFKEDDKYWPMGTLNSKGILISAHLGGNFPFFGDNIRQAVRYLYLKTVESKKTSKSVV